MSRLSSIAPADGSDPNPKFHSSPRRISFPVPSQLCVPNAHAGPFLSLLKSYRPLFFYFYLYTGTPSLAMYRS